MQHLEKPTLNVFWVDRKNKVNLPDPSGWPPWLPLTCALLSQRRAFCCCTPAGSSPPERSTPSSREESRSPRTQSCPWPWFQSEQVVCRNQEGGVRERGVTLKASHFLFYNQLQTLHNRIGGTNTHPTSLCCHHLWLEAAHVPSKLVQLLSCLLTISNRESHWKCTLWTLFKNYFKLPAAHIQGVILLCRCGCVATLAREIGGKADVNIAHKC